MDDTPAAKVYLYVYDLSGGLAASLSPSLLGKQIDGIWHTSIVVHGKEYYFGGGISVARPGTTVFGQPHQTIELGETHLPAEVISDLLADLRTRFSDQSYDLLSNNCNNFTDEMAKLLLGTGIPDHIVGLPDEVMSTPLGQMIKPMLMSVQTRLGSVSETPVPAPAPVAPKQDPAQRTKEEFERKLKREFQALIAQGNLTPNQAAALALERVQSSQRAGENTGEKSQA
eukprot:g6469.t1